VERMKKTSNKLFDYHGHIDCRNLSSDLDKLEWESKLSVKLKASGESTLASLRALRNRFNSNSNFLIEVING